MAAHIPRLPTRAHAHPARGQHHSLHQAWFVQLQGQPVPVPSQHAPPCPFWTAWCLLPRWNAWALGARLCSVGGWGVGGLAQGLGGWLCWPVAVPIGLWPLNLLL